MDNFKSLVGVAALIFATSALAGGPEQVPVTNSGFYLSGGAGLNFLSNSNPYYTTGWGAAGAIGYRFNSFRVEAEAAYLSHGVRSPLQDLEYPPFETVLVNPFRLVTVMANAYYDFDFGSRFVPYVGAGLGWAHTWTKFANTLIHDDTLPPTVVTVKFDQNGFAYQGILGLDYKINESVRVGLSYHAVGWTGDLNRNRNNSFNIITSNRFLNSSNFENKLNLGVIFFF